MYTRRFIMSPALTRLVRWYRGSTGICEGHFNERPGRRVSLRIEGAVAHLILSVPHGAGDPHEIPVRIPVEHAWTLLESCPGRISFEQSSLLLPDGNEVIARLFKDRQEIVTLAVTFPDREAAESFTVPSWFGMEVTDDYANRDLALNGLPQLEDFSVPDAALQALMNVLESQPDQTTERASGPGLPQAAAIGLLEGLDQAIAPDSARTQSGSENLQRSASATPGSIETDAPSDWTEHGLPSAKEA